MAGTESGHPVKEHERQLGEIRDIQKDHEKRIKLLEEAYARQDEKQKQIFMTLGEVKQLVASATEEMKKNNENAVESMRTIIGNLQVDVERLKGKPGVTLDKVKYALISAIISGIVGLIIGLVSHTAGGG